jgi:ubiquinone/menaquinone biosynthesis C-methylase UbiE
MQQFFLNEIATLIYGDETLLAFKDHFDPASPGLTSQFLADSAAYDAQYFNLDGMTKQISRTLERAGLSRFSPNQILDIGSGTGNSVLVLARMFNQAQIIATDLSPSMLSILRKRVREAELQNRVHIAVANAADINSRPETFDLVMGSSMLHHLHQPFSALLRLLGGLAPGGVAIFYEPFQAGNVLLRQCLCEIIRRSEAGEDIDPLIVEYLKVVVRGIDIFCDEDRSNPIIPRLDDKWLFTKDQFENVANEAGCEVKIFTTNILKNTFREKTKAKLRYGIGATVNLPSWAISVLDSCDEAISPSLREELLMEGAIVFSRKKSA